jgi:hypothetical protein
MNYWGEWGLEGEAFLTWKWRKTKLCILFEPLRDFKK